MSKNKSRDFRVGLEKDKRRRAKNKTRKPVRRQKSKKPRRNDWMQYSDEYWEEVEVETFERVMPLDENERRQAVEQMAYKSKMVEAEPATGKNTEQSYDLLGTVTEMSSGLCTVRLEDREVLCSVRGSLKTEETGFTNILAVGDRVAISMRDDKRGVVEEILPRASMLARQDVFANHLQQVVVANVDQVLIVTAWRQPHIWLELIDRYLISAERNNLQPVICLNKMDLAEDLDEVHVIMQPYLDLEYPVLFTSAVSGMGIEDLQAQLDGCTTVLAGMSGVGKSSLLIALHPELELRTKTVSEQSGEGRHTTTQVSLLWLETGAVVDTPGMREFGLAGLHPNDVEIFFPEMEGLAHMCRFRDCRHISESECAIQEAVALGKVPESRYHSYKKIYEELSGS
jgi:ribosome biogenesis GTPase